MNIQFKPIIAELWIAMSFDVRTVFLIHIIVILNFDIIFPNDCRLDLQGPMGCKNLAPVVGFSLFAQALQMDGRTRHFIDIDYKFLD